MSEKFPKNIKIIGGGQLGRMLTEAATPLGFRVSAMQENSVNSPAHQAGAIPVEGSIKDGDAIFNLADDDSVLTAEIEHIDANGLRRAEDAGFDVEPKSDTFVNIQDKLNQKRWLWAAGFPVPDFAGDINDTVRLSKWDEIIVKNRRGGYDGRGNHGYYDVMDAAYRAKHDIVDENMYAERVIDFDMELAVIVVRDKEGQVSSYDPVETMHENNICHMVVSPARIDPDIALEAKELGEAIGHELLQGAGVFAIEMFVSGEKIYVNEIAPRVHNSGHLTLQAHVTSQFEQHVRAITGLPLGSTDQVVPAAAMINILGTHPAPLDRSGMEKVLRLPGVHINWYGKDSRLERKIGHIVATADDIDSALRNAKRARLYLTEV